MKRLLFVLGLGVIAGCGTGYYDDLYSQRLKQLDLTSAFAALWPGTTDITPILPSIRVPKIFAKTYNKNSIYTDDPHGEIDKDRLNPPFMNPFPGLVGCYESFQQEKRRRTGPAGLSLQRASVN